MVAVFRIRSLLVCLGLMAMALAVPLAGPAAAQEDDPTSGPTGAPTVEPTGDPAADEQGVAAGGECVATGYLVGSAEELSALRSELVDQSVHEVGGVPLVSGQTWVVPDGSQPLVVLDSTVPLSGGSVSVSLAGQSFEAGAQAFEEPAYRYVSNVTMPHLGSTVRSLGMTVDSDPCEVALALAVDRSVWSTRVGGPAVAVTVLFGLLTVLVARLRKGGWLRRFLFAAPLGLVAGAGQAVVLIEAGVVGPFAPVPWWMLLVGLGLAAVLPLTRWRRRRRAADAAAGSVAVGMPPAHAPLGGFQIAHAVARTEVAGIYRATRTTPAETAPAETTPAESAPAPVAERALLKVALPERYGEPVARLRLEREAQALAGWTHAHVLPLREIIPAVPPAPEGPPTLVFEDVDGVPLRHVLAGGSLSGPQVVSVVIGVLDGLAALHARDLVHRDVCPDNVWLTTDGRVLLANFELACAGVEHPLSPDGAAPYSSPEQLTGQVLDERSDLYACAVLLGELLTGAPVTGVPTGLPEPLTGPLAAALSIDPAGRPASAEQFAAALRDAAVEAFGNDWTGRGALAGALVAHGAIGAGAAGYALAGGGAAAGTAVVAGGGASAGGTAAGAAGLGAAAAAGPGAAGGTAAGALGAATAGLTPAGSAAAMPASQTATQVAGQTATQAAGQATVGGPVGALVNAAVAVAAAGAVALGVVLVDPDQAQAQESVVITPEQALVIFIRTVDEGFDRSFTHFNDDARETFETVRDLDDSVAEGRLTDIEAGVPPDQFQHPAWFVASGLIRYDDGQVSLFARFDREADDEPWQMTSLRLSNQRLLAAPMVDGDGWLVPLPDIGDLLVDPATLPDRYRDWFLRAFADGEVGTDEVLTLRGGAGMIGLVAEEPLRYSGDDPERVTPDYDMSSGEVDITDPILLADGTILVQFVNVAHYTLSYLSAHRAGACDDYWLLWEGIPGGRFRVATNDFLTTVDAYVPVVGMVPPLDPTPAPDEEPDEAADETADEEAADDQDEPIAELALEPVDPDAVVIEHRRLEQDNVGGERC